MKEYNVLEDMRYWQPERPDEWKMNEFIRGVEKLSQELQEKREEVEVLRLYGERLRGSLLDALNHLAMSEKSPIGKSKAVGVLNEAFFEIPAQSINHIKAYVEEETIERCVEQIRNKGDSSSYDMVQDALEHIADLLEAQPRKYKEQSNED